MDDALCCNSDGEGFGSAIIVFVDITIKPPLQADEAQVPINIDEPWALFYF